MDGYKVFFDYGGKTYTLPTNPEEIEVSSTIAIEKYEILKLGQVAVPTNMGLKEYTFECEFPLQRGGKPPHYVPNKKEFRNPEYFLKLFEKWRSKLIPVRFMAGRYTDSVAELESDSINAFVLIEELTITEKAGEEGDKYVSFRLLEYKEYGKHEKPTEVDKKTGKKKKKVSTKTNPKSTGYYIVKNGDTLWGIATKYYGTGVKCNVIFNANKNKIKNPNLLTVGQKLTIPTSDEFSKYSASLPKMKTTTTTKTKTASLATKKAFVGEMPVAGISLLLDSIVDASGNTGSGVSSGGHSYSGASSGF